MGEGVFEGVSEGVFEGVSEGVFEGLPCVTGILKDVVSKPQELLHYNNIHIGFIL